MITFIPGGRTLQKYEIDWQRQPRVTRDEILHDLVKLGIKAGSSVLVHSSLSSIGNVVGGAESVIDALLAAVGPDGTVVFPTLTGDETDGPEHPPHIDALHSPCWTGRIPETARLRPDALRSLHPTHSVAAIGAMKEEFTTGHETGVSPCDEQSPYYRLIRSGGLILLLGVDQECNTTLHCCEELAAVPYHLQPETTAGQVTDRDGARHVVTNQMHQSCWERDFSQVDQWLAGIGALQIGKIGQATARLISASHMADHVLMHLRSDPISLLSDAARLDFTARVLQ